MLRLGSGSDAFPAYGPPSPGTSHRPTRLMSHLAIATLGILSVFQSTTAVPLPPSRKTRALLAYLVLATRPQRREHLIDRFWGDGPDDPRGALRWSLSKIRALIDTDRPRVIADRETVAFDAGEVTIDLHAARQIGPDDAVTSDFRPDRLNIEYGRAGRIERVSCY